MRIWFIKLQDSGNKEHITVLNHTLNFPITEFQEIYEIK